MSIEIFRPRYDSATGRSEKTCIAAEVVDVIKQSGRFLRREERTGEWVEVSDKVARDKVCQVRSKQVVVSGVAPGCRVQAVSILTCSYGRSF